MRREWPIDFQHAEHAPTHRESGSLSAVQPGLPVGPRCRSFKLCAALSLNERPCRRGPPWRDDSRDRGGKRASISVTAALTGWTLSPVWVSGQLQVSRSLMLQVRWKCTDILLLQHLHGAPKCSSDGPSVTHTLKHQTERLRLDFVFTLG